MKTISQRIRARLLETQEQNSSIVPAWLRTILRATSGGNTWTAKFVRGMLWKYRWLLLAAFIANVGAGLAEGATLAVFSLALNQMTAAISNTAVDTSGTINTIALQISQFLGGQEPILILIGLAVLLQITRSSLDYTGQSATTFLRVWLESDLQRRIFAQLMNLRYQSISDSRLGNLTSYNGQVGEVGLLLQAVNNLLNDLAIMFAYAAILFWISWQFTIVAIVALVLLSIGLRNIRDSIRRTGTGFLNISVHLNERVLEYLTGLRLVHIFVREDDVIKEVNSLINSSIPPRRMGLLQRALIVPLVQVITIIGIGAFVIVGYWFLRDSSATRTGELVTYIFILYRVMPRLTSFNYSLAQVSSQLPYVSRIAQLLDPMGREVEYTEGTPITSLQHGVEFRGVSLRYPEGERDAVNNVNFHIPAGKMIAFVGPSGSGKSSIINLMLGLYRPTGGQILIDDLDLQKSDLASWRRMIGVVDQDTQIFSNTIAENIRFGKPKATDAEVAAAAKIAYADLFINNLPQLYNTEVGDRGHKLSGGQRQRIAIARAVINDPTLLLFDEATSALDSQSERLIQESLEVLRKERTVVVIAHRLSTIVKADQIILLDNGQILERGTHQELLTLGGRYAAMWRLQADAS